MRSVACAFFSADLRKSLISRRTPRTFPVIATMSDQSRGFQPVDPWNRDDLKKKRRNLPDLQVGVATYFVSFRCRPGVVLTPKARDLVMAASRFWDGRRIDLDAAVVMPDHGHALFRILDGSPLEKIVHSVKGYSARQVNALMGRAGPVWQQESFDHIIRYRRSWEAKLEYIRQNPVHKGLVTKPEEYPWLYLNKRGGEDAACVAPANEDGASFR